MYTVQELAQALENLSGLHGDSPVYLCFRGMFATVDGIAIDPDSNRIELYNEVDFHIMEGLDQ